MLPVCYSIEACAGYTRQIEPACGSSMNKVLVILGVTVAVALAMPAMAADMVVNAPASPAPIFSWTGCYVGGNVGGGSANKSFVESFNSVLPGASDGHHRATGWLGGGQIGCDYQFASNWVVGIQGMWDAARLTGSNLSPDVQVLGDFTLHTKISSIATVTGELGFLFTPTTKFYGKAGIGWVRDQFTCDGPACSLTYFAKDTRSGFDLGVGLAWMFAPNWDFFVEYNHMWLDTKTLTFTTTASDVFFGERIKQDLNQVLIGVNYRFR